MTRPLNPALAWAPAIMLSILAHAALVMIVQTAIAPDPVPMTEEVRARIAVSSLDVPAQRAEAREAEGEAAESAEAAGERIGVRDVPTSRARPVAPPRQTLAALASRGTSARPASAAGEPVVPARAEMARLSAAPATEPAIAATAMPAVIIIASASPVERIAGAGPTGLALAPVSAEPARLATTAAGGQPLPASTPLAAQVVAAAAEATLVAVAGSRGPPVPASAPPAATMVAAAPPAETVPDTRPEGPGLAPVTATLDRVETIDTAGADVSERAPVAAAPTNGLSPRPTAGLAGAVGPTSAAEAAVKATAALAWTGAADAILDEKSLAAIQSFMRPGDVASSDSFAGSVRDGIGAALAQFPCSRLQAAFQPETGGLEIRGHVPLPELRTQVVDLLTDSVGGAIPIGGSVLVLPQPQCGVLDAVEGLGMPQSRDQKGDPLVVGEEAQARIVQYEDGTPVRMTLQAPEFDSHIYVDYYDGDGNVIHLMPNEHRTENRFAADAPFSIGHRGSGLIMTAAAPFGQDIAVVLASTVPLYDGARPLVERAVDYLPWLHERIDGFRRTDPGFRGEWVYLFVMTGPTGAFAGR